MSEERISTYSVLGKQYPSYIHCINMICNCIAGDSLSNQNGMKFTTKDQDNDTHNKNCAVMNHSGWWFKDCFWSNLNGWYRNSAVHQWESIIWYTLGKTNLALKNARMMIRSKV